MNLVASPKKLLTAPRLRILSIVPFHSCLCLCPLLYFVSKRHTMAANPDYQAIDLLRDRGYVPGKTDTLLPTQVTDNMSSDETR